MILLLAFFLLPAWVGAQISFIPADYFPAEKEFADLLEVTSDITFDDPGRLAGVDGGSLMRAAGFMNYSRRSYSTGGASTLSIEVVSMLDSRAAYSLLTLLRETEIKTGPPGSFYVEAPDGIRFAQGRIWVRITGSADTRDLAKKIAVSVSNRIGSPADITPSIVLRLPTLGYDESGLKYFPDITTYATYAGASARPYLPLDSNMEIVQSRYSLKNAEGYLFLLDFPTPQIAEDFFSGSSLTSPAMNEAHTLYMKLSGTLVACLDGTFDPASADTLLNSIRLDYSVKWLQDDGTEESVLWGIPGTILVTVVNSIFFVSLLCLLSVIVGAALGVFKFILDDKILKKKDEKFYPFTRLRLR
ncbi:MAG TPA: DUF6599 family protein [Acidobacteriota bacterium]|nr:DUF6599 family protein [Acidobacteriota bacterium]